MRGTGLRWVGLAALCALPSAGQVASSTVSPYVDLRIIEASVPKKIKAGSFLTVQVTATGGGCTTYDRMLVTRSTGKIDLRLQMRRWTGSQPQTCTGDIRPISVRYMDALYPSIESLNGRGDSVTVVVNGKRAGVVKVTPG